MRRFWKSILLLLMLALIAVGATLAVRTGTRPPREQRPSAPISTPATELSPVPTRQPIPTREPIPTQTAAPTFTPTSKPISTLTIVPTQKPTPKPTAKPTPSPTQKPTPKPSPKPTPKPTSKPTGGASDKGNGSKDKLVALTFDDGPGDATKRILRALRKADGRATFFMVGDRVADYPEIAKAVAAQGNQIGTHSWSHESLTRLNAEALREDLKKSLDRIESVTGVRPKALRPPYGNVNANVKKAGGSLGLVVVNWSVDTLDWKTRSADSVYREIMAHVCDGAIVLCHDLYESTAAAVERAIPELRRKGYRLVTVNELLDARDPGWRAGQLYFGAMTG